MLLPDLVKSPFNFKTFPLVLLDVSYLLTFKQTKRDYL